MNFGAVLKAFDAAVALRDVTRRLKTSEPPVDPGVDLAESRTVRGITGHIEARLTNVVVAALKEAFDRDHARLELERTQLDDQRRRAEEAMRLEQRRLAADREVGRLRLLAGTAMVGWIASILLLGWRLPLASAPSRALLVSGWVLLLAAMGTAFSAMASAGDREHPAQLPQWLLIAGLGLTALTLLV
ncbi:MAG: hypothetical protein AB7P99_07635 [Vicinamibacterales bacterium]